MAIQMDFVYEPGQGGKRRVYRVLAPGLNVRFVDGENFFSIADLSVGGMSIRLPNEHDFMLGTESIATFSIKDKIIMPSVKVKTLRLDPDKKIAAFEFTNLNERQEAMLDKLVLALQKHNIKQSM